MQAVAIASSTSPTDKPERKPKVTREVAHAISLMVEQGKPWDQAAVEAGLTTRAMRMALEKAHVIAHLRQQKHLLREAASAANIHRLVQIRDKADNQPAVNAIKVLEQLGEEQAQRGSGASASPGVTIRIVNVNAPGHDILTKTVTSEQNQGLTDDAR